MKFNDVGNANCRVLTLPVPESEVLSASPIDCTAVGLVITVL